MRRRLASALLLAVALAGGAFAAPAVESTYSLSQIFRLPPEHCDNSALAANTAENYTVPTLAGSLATRRLVLTFSGTCLDTSFCVRKGGTAAIASTDVTNGSACERNPVGYKVIQGTVLSIIAPEACNLIECLHLEDVSP